MEKGIYKKFSFFKDQVEVSPKTNKMILPISIKETASKTIFRKSPKSEKTIIEGMNSTGIEEFFNTGDMLGTILTDVFPTSTSTTTTSACCNAASSAPSAAEPSASTNTT